MNSSNYVGLTEAARIAGVTHQTVRNWARTGAVEVGRDDDILAFMNHNKNGRPHVQYYYLKQIEAMRDQRNATMVEPDNTMIRIEDAGKALCVAPRTMTRIRERQNLTEYVGKDGNVYLRRQDIADQIPGVTYRTSANRQTLDRAAEKYGLTPLRKTTP